MNIDYKTDKVLKTDQFIIEKTVPLANTSGMSLSHQRTYGFPIQQFVNDD